MQDIVKQGQIIRALWDEFELITIPIQAPEIQRVEMKKAFYMGALVVMDQIVMKIGEDESVGEEEGALLLQQIHQECMSFFTEAGSQ